MSQRTATSTLRELREIGFDDTLLSEIEAINIRRQALGREPISKDVGSCEHPKVTDAVGLALSGGGVRSAAFSLGVLQALNHNGVLDRIDYLSTVSGGGLIGTCLSATMSRTGGEFVFGSSPGKDSADKPLASEISDTRAVGHLRNYSNYLIPHGVRDLLTGMAIVLRGLVANFAAVFPIVLFAAAVTIFANPNRSDLKRADLLGQPFDFLPAHFGVTIAATLIGLIVFLLWAFYRSLPREDSSELSGWLPVVGVTILIIIAIFFFGELQPFIINGMFELSDMARQLDGDAWALVAGAIQAFAAIATPIAAFVMFFRGQLGETLKSEHASSKWSARSRVAASRAILWIAGAAPPLLIWVGYLYLSYWGIVDVDVRTSRPASASIAIAVNSDEAEQKKPAPSDKSDGPKQKELVPIVITVNREGPAQEQLARFVITVNKAGPGPDPINWCGQQGVVPGDHTPRWLLIAAACLRYAWMRVWEAQNQEAQNQGGTESEQKQKVQNYETETIYGRVINRPITYLYFVAGIILFLLSFRLGPNANSLHRLYRDRLSKAFLFDPTQTKSATRTDQGRDFAPLDRMRVTELSPAHAPYHLINATLNVQGSDYANRRGRDADFFLISPLHIGSLATGYAAMKDYEAHSPDFDLATATAISGAAASSNMGAMSIRALTWTLALLNVRLGYWLRNPRFTCRADRTKPAVEPRAAPVFLFYELFSLLYEDREHIYVTDGGHIENLGLYELLKRRCKLIIVIDAETDFEMHFPSFITLLRYARIDLGIRIEMPWNSICATTRSWMAPDRGVQQQAPSMGPHAAIGVIEYGGGEKGHLLYIKSSLTGDENDYILDYARRYRSFPHETTSDQFFSEEQFEVYRALGFHSAHGVLCGRDAVEWCAGGQPSRLSLKASGNETIDAIRRALKA